MKKVSDHFYNYEIECQCGCGFNAMSPDTLAVADSIRDFQGSAIVCSSGCRCVDHNAEEGGAKKSRHLPRHTGENVFEADGMDLHVEDASACAEFLEDFWPTVSYILYSWGMHIDTRPYDERYTADNR